MYVGVVPVVRCSRARKLVVYIGSGVDDYRFRGHLEVYNSICVPAIGYYSATLRHQYFSL
jgi:hypothetical protein